MAYNSNKGPQQHGDIKFEGDPLETQVDFEDDFIALKTNGEQRFIVSGSFITASIPISCSVGITASSFVGDGSGLTDVVISGSARVYSSTGLETSGYLKVTGSSTFANSLSGSSTLEIVGNTILGSSLNVSGTTTLDGFLSSSNILYSVGSISSSGDIAATGSIHATNMYATEFFGDLEGAIRFDAVNDEGDSISRGQVVYINGVSGQTPTVALAAADDAAKMPAFGLAGSNAAQGASIQIVTFGSIQNLNLSTLFPGETFAEGDPVFVQTGSGGVSGSLTTTRPTGSNNLLQNVGQVVRNGGGGDNQIKVGGAGRTNATPNLDKGYLFVGNDTNCSAQDNTVFISSSANKVGINNTDPTHALTITGDISGSSTLEIVGNTIFGGELNVSGNILATGTTHLSSSGLEALRIAKADGDAREIVFENEGTDKVSMYMNSAENFFIRQEDATKDINLRIGTTNVVVVDGSATEVAFAWDTTHANISGSGNLKIGGSISASADVYVTGAVSASTFFGDGSNLDGISAGAVDTYTNAGDNRIITSVNATTINGESNLTFDGTNLQVVGNISGSSNLQISSASFNGDLAVSGTVRGKMVQMTNHAYNIGTAGERWIPWYNLADLNFTSHDWTGQAVAPFSGRLLRVVFRPGANDCGSTKITLYKQVDGTENMSLSRTYVEEQTVTCAAAAATSNVFNFTGSAHFSQGEVIGVAIDPTNGPDNANVTCVWEYDIFGV
jgi:hypothetical protein